MRKREPNFENVKKVLSNQVPDRPVLFELFMDGKVYEMLSGEKCQNPSDALERLKNTVAGFKAGGYDYATTHASDFRFFPLDMKGHTQDKTYSMNDTCAFTDWESYEKFTWREPSDYDTSRLEKIKPYLPDGMKLQVMGPGGVLENLIDLVGYDNLCIMLFEEPELVKEVTDQIGKRLLAYYEPALQCDTVGFICSNDDWGFNTQTLISPADLRKYIFPWHKKIVELAHHYNKPCILHSCGYINDIMDDVIDDMGFDARHSYEDNIVPVEEAYEKYGSRIAVLGGIDLNFVCTQTPEAVYKRSRAMLERTADRGGYALGTGNSVPYYVPYENYLAMLKAAWEFEK